MIPEVKRAIGVIAGYTMAAGVSQNVPGMEGFAEFFLRQQKKRDQAIIEELRTAMREVQDSVAKGWEEEFKKEGAS